MTFIKDIKKRADKLKHSSGTESINNVPLPTWREVTNTIQKPELPPPPPPPPPPHQIKFNPAPLLEISELITGGQINEYQPQKMQSVPDTSADMEYESDTINKSAKNFTSNSAIVLFAMTGLMAAILLIK